MASDITIDTSSVHDVQVARLDADMFSADDIHGGTEGLIGSGNLNYLVLQSQQTNEAARNTNPFDFRDGGYDGLGGLGVFPGSNIGESGNASGAHPSDLSGRTDLSEFLGTHSNHNSGENSVFNSLTALNTDSATHVRSSLTNNNSSNESSSNFFPGDNGINGHDGSGLNGNNGTNGHDGTTPTIPETPPVDSHIGIHVVSDLLTANVDELINPVGDLVGGINLDVTGTLGNILSPDDGLLPHPGAIADGIIGDNHMINDLHLGPFLDGAENLADNAVGAVNPAVTGLLPFTPDILNTAGDLLDHLNGDSELFVTSDLGLPDAAGLSGLGNLALHVPLTPVEDIAGSINIHLSADSDQSHLLTDGLNLQPADLGITSTGDVLNGIDTGLSTGDLMGSSSGLVQDLSGDLTSGNITDGLLANAGNLPDNLMNSAADLSSPVADILQTIGDGHVIDSPDLTSVTDYAQDVANVAEPVTSLAGDPTGGSLIGDIDSFINSLTNAATADFAPLSPVPDQNVGSIGDILSNAVPATPSWPEATIGGAVDSATPAAESGGLPATLPDPVGLLSDGMNLIHDTTSHASGALGGLTGGHHGGLFG